jgi:hypothetical protein
MSPAKNHSLRKPEKVEAEYINFWHDWKDDKPKTQVWNVFSKSDNEWLGQISWFSQWRKYAFHSTCRIDKESHVRYLSDIWFEERCLRDIANFIEELTQKHRERRQKV